MKKLFLLLTATILMVGCYNDDNIWNKVNDLDSRVTTLEKTVKEMNSNITNLQSAVEALNKGKVITATQQTTSGYVLTFSDGSKLTLTNGTDGKDAPVIGVQATDGVYYWTVTTNGTTTFLKDANGNKLKVTGDTGATGKDGVTPTMGVDTDGYWTVNMGSGATQVKDASGNAVKAKGVDGVSPFKSFEETASGVNITLNNGSTILLPKLTALADTEFQTKESKVFDLSENNVIDGIIGYVTDGWKASFDGTKLTVTAPSSKTTANAKATIKMVVAYTGGTTRILNLNATVYEIKTLTFEDTDYLGDGNYLGNKNWSSLIDPTQYGGKLLYGDSGSGPTSYCWYDKNNTELASEFPTNFGTTCYWGGGHAVSDYVETTLTNGDYQHQLAVPVKDAKTGYGGHNGSKNFCVHFGYMDGSPYNQTSALPYFYFKDKVARVVESMYVCATTYLLNVETNGNGLSKPASDKDYIWISATGYDTAGKKTGEVKMYMAYKGGFVKDWTKWDLSSLGKVAKVDFNVGGTNDNGYGFSQPAYFAYDDVAVKF